MLAALIVSASAAAAAELRAGVGVVDMTWNLGACSGQYCAEEPYPLSLLEGGEIDPYVHHRTKDRGYGVQSRLTARAIVVEGSNGRRIALLKTDNYLAQDMLLRRVGQLLNARRTAGLSYDDILHHVTHDHSSPYYGTLSAGVWLFQDVYDQRMFEFQARKIAEAIETAAANLRPARLGATTVRHTIYKGNVVGPATADDGTPAGYPLEYGDHGLVVLRFDDVSVPEEPKPLAVWINFGEHPEGLDGHSLHSADFLGPLERFVERDVGAPLVFSQGDVGSAERSGNPTQLLRDDGTVCGSYPEGGAENRADCPFGEGTLRDWNHHGYAQTERNVRYLADAVVAGWNAIGSGDATVPFTTELVVDRLNAWVPGPVSHPHPSVSNCRTEPTIEGNPGLPILGLPDCERSAASNDRAQTIFETLKAERLPVPENYDAPSFGALEENLRLRLQAFRLGEIVLASCACEAQADLILNFETRADETPANVYDGFDWACLLPEHEAESVCEDQKTRFYDPAVFPTGVPGDNFTPAGIERLRAQVHNDAAGWDAPENALTANAEPAEPAAIRGNFTKEELPPALGYRLPVGVGHAGDYNGYTVSYREYMNRDHYRKALTAYGPHTADYMVSRMVRMAGALKGGPPLAPEPHDVLAQADEARQGAFAITLGSFTRVAYDTYLAALPDDAGSPAALEQPQAIERFDAATFTWRGGSTAIDNPIARVERLVDGTWAPFADGSGEVQTMVRFPEGVPGILDAYVGNHEWSWTANFEAFDAFPSRLGHTPSGTYRFVVDGAVQKGGAAVPYHLESAPFTVSPWTGIEVTNVSTTGGNVTFEVPPIRYPRTYESAFRFIADDGDPRICDTCTFRPWARDGRLASARVTVARAAGGSETVSAECTPQPDGGQTCRAPTALAGGDQATVEVFDTFGETSGPIAVP